MARLRSTAREVEDAWLGGAPTPVGRAAVRGGFALLFALGVLHWGLVFEGGDLPLTDYDWSKESLYYSVWQQALTRGAVPYYVAPPVLDTDQFLAIPETNISPQILLLLWLDVGDFLLVNVLLLYAIGFTGTLVLRRELRVSPLALVPFLLLFNFNGYIVSQLAVGHSMWVGYFLFPWLLVLLVRARRAEACDWPRHAAWVGLFLFALLLQGAFQLLIVTVGALLLLALLDRRLRLPLLAGTAAGLLLNAFRLYPAWEAFRNRHTTEPFVTGFPTPVELLEGLAVARGPAYVGPPGGLPLGWWEYDYFVGLLGVLLLVAWGVRPLLQGRSVGGLTPPRALAVWVATLTILSMDHLLLALRLLPLGPLASLERFPSRLLLFPLLALLLVAVVHLDADLRQRLPRWTRGPFLLLCAILAVDLWRHAALWHIGDLPPHDTGKYAGLAASLNEVPADTGYRYRVERGMVLTLVGLATVVAVLKSERLRRRLAALGALARPRPSPRPLEEEG